MQPTAAAGAALARWEAYYLMACFRRVGLPSSQPEPSTVPATAHPVFQRQALPPP